MRVINNKSKGIEVKNLNILETVLQHLLRIKHTKSHFQKIFP